MTNWPARNDNRKQWIIAIPYQQFYSVVRASRILGVGPSGVYLKIKRGTLSGVQVEGVTMVRHAALIEYIEKRKKSELPVGRGSRIVPIVPVAPKFTHDSSKRMPKPTPELLTIAETEFGFLKD